MSERGKIQLEPFVFTSMASHYGNGYHLVVRGKNLFSSEKDYGRLEKLFLQFTRLENLREPVLVYLNIGEIGLLLKGMPLKSDWSGRPGTYVTALAFSISQLAETSAGNPLAFRLDKLPFVSHNRAAEFDRKYGSRFARAVELPPVEFEIGRRILGESTLLRLNEHLGEVLAALEVFGRGGRVGIPPSFPAEDFARWLAVLTPPRKRPALTFSLHTPPELSLKVAACFALDASFPALPGSSPPKVISPGTKPRGKEWKAAAVFIREMVSAGEDLERTISTFDREVVSESLMPALFWQNLSRHGEYVNILGRPDPENVEIENFTEALKHLWSVDRQRLSDYVRKQGLDWLTEKSSWLIRLVERLKVEQGSFKDTFLGALTASFRAGAGSIGLRGLAEVFSREPALLRLADGPVSDLIGSTEYLLTGEDISALSGLPPSRIRDRWLALLALHHPLTAVGTERYRVRLPGLLPVLDGRHLERLRRACLRDGRPEVRRLLLGLPLEASASFSDFRRLLEIEIDSGDNQAIYKTLRRLAKKTSPQQGREFIRLVGKVASKSRRPEEDVIEHLLYRLRRRSPARRFLKKRSAALAAALRPPQSRLKTTLQYASAIAVGSAVAILAIAIFPDLPGNRFLADNMARARTFIFGSPEEKAFRQLMDEFVAMVEPDRATLNEFGLSRWQEIMDLKEEARSLVSEDPDEARILISEAKDKLSAAVSEADYWSNRKKIEELLEPHTALLSEFPGGPATQRLGAVIERARQLAGRPEEGVGYYVQAGNLIEGAVQEAMYLQARAGFKDQLRDPHLQSILEEYCPDEWEEIRSVSAAANEMDRYSAEGREAYERAGVLLTEAIAEANPLLESELAEAKESFEQALEEADLGLLKMYGDELWRQVKARKAEAEGAGTDRFKGIQAYAAAGELLRQAIPYAENAQAAAEKAYREARDNWETAFRDVQGEHELLVEFGGKGWKNIKRLVAIAEAAAEDPREGKRHYEEARKELIHVLQRARYAQARKEYEDLVNETRNLRLDYYTPRLLAEATRLAEEGQKDRDSPVGREKYREAKGVLAKAVEFARYRAEHLEIYREFLSSEKAFKERLEATRDKVPGFEKYLRAQWEQVSTLQKEAVALEKINNIKSARDRYREANTLLLTLDTLLPYVEAKQGYESERQGVDSSLMEEHAAELWEQAERDRKAAEVYFSQNDAVQSAKYFREATRKLREAKRRLDRLEFDFKIDSIRVSFEGRRRGTVRLTLSGGNLLSQPVTYEGTSGRLSLSPDSLEPNFRIRVNPEYEIGFECRVTADRQVASSTGSIRFQGKEIIVGETIRKFIIADKTDRSVSLDLERDFRRRTGLQEIVIKFRVNN